MDGTRSEPGLSGNGSEHGFRTTSVYLNAKLHQETDTVHRDRDDWERMYCVTVIHTLTTKADDQDEAELNYFL